MYSIKSNYHSNSGIISDEILALDTSALEKLSFSSGGDSGSFVGGADRYISGMIRTVNMPEEKIM